ncbi:MAG: hypothetical protein ACOC4C_00245 [Fibrobacterota bacterium]
MSYNLIITHVPPKRARSVLARHIARDPTISLQQALQLIDNAPFVYSHGLSREQAAREIAGLKKMGIQLRIEEESKQKTAVSSQPEEEQASERQENDSFEDRQPDSTNRQAAISDEPVPIEGDKPGKSLPESPSEQDSQKTENDFTRPPEHKQNSNHLTHRSTEKKPSGSILIQPSSVKKGPGKFGVVFRLLLVVLLLGIIASLVYYADQNKDFKIASDGPVLVKKSSGTKSSSGTQKKGKSQTKRARTPRREPVSSIHKARSTMYVDSAVEAMDLMKTINFYRVALSFNQYNIDAWFGLINAYKSAGMHSQAREAEKKMKELFGMDILEIGTIVKRFGKLEDAVGPINGMYRVSYVTTTVSRSALEKETFLLARALKSSFDCKTLILFASTAKGAGLLARIPMNDFPSTLSEYTKRAHITMAH